MKTVIGIDLGGSTTKIVGFSRSEGKLNWIEPQVVKADDPLTATYGAFGKFTNENSLPLTEIDKVVLTGVGSSHVHNSLYGLPSHLADEFECIGRGGLFLSGLDDALVVSMGTGTAIVHAKGKTTEYLGGTGVGGGTLVGLSKLLLNTRSVTEANKLAENGDLGNIDLRIKDLVEGDGMSELKGELTASNFANLSDMATKNDVARGILNLVFETVGMVSIFAARWAGVKDIVLTGNVTNLSEFKRKFAEFNTLGYGVNFIVPKNAGFATAIGAALIGLEDKSD